MFTYFNSNICLYVYAVISDAYPEEPPVIFISSKTMHPKRNDILLSHLRGIATDQKPCSSKLKLIYDSALAWISDQNIDLNIRDSSKSPRTSKQKHKSSAKHDGDTDFAEKKPSMKTAQDVINRIQWDDNISTELCVVGYIDRFLGIQEKTFSSFSWEDIASVDYETLAIPRHRIQYFKYADVEVWNKNKRLDDVFGSTGSGVTITDVISKLNLTDSHNLKSTMNDNDCSDDDSDDDDIPVNIKLSENDTEDDDGLTRREKYWGAKHRPNYFLCIRVTDPDVVSRARHAQEQMVAVDSLYRTSCIPSNKLHVTLCCLGLDDEAEVAHCVSVLRKLEAELEGLNPNKITLEFDGVDNFYLNTIYAKVRDNEPLTDFVNHLKISLTRAGVKIRDVFDFVPHMTLMKFARQLQKESHTKYVEAGVFESVKGLTFGNQTFDNIHLCSMSADVSCDGFYVCPTTMFFQ